jgi:putative ABC transport system ATP-binding protein
MPTAITEPGTGQSTIGNRKSAIDKAVRLRSVTKTFGTGDEQTKALDDVTLELPYGEMVLLVGPSGCGKTTLISCVAGLLDPTAGEVEVLGKNITKMWGGSKVRFRGEHIGFVFQQYNLLPALTAAENASVPLLIAGWNRKKAVEKASYILNQVGLGNKLKSYANQLSGGQQQRVAIARALVHDPQLLVCDEPTAALDGASGRTVMGLIKQVAVQPDRAVIVVTHDNRVYDFGDRIVSMSDGKVEKVETRSGERAVLGEPRV